MKSLCFSSHLVLAVKEERKNKNDDVMLQLSKFNILVVMDCGLLEEMRESVRISDMKIFLFNAVPVACDNSEVNDECPAM